MQVLKIIKYLIQYAKITLGASFSAHEGGQFCFKLRCFYLGWLKCVAAANSHYFLFMKE